MSDTTASAIEAPRFRYSARLANEIEAKWQDRWERDHTFWAPNPSGPLRRRLRGSRRPPQALRARHVPVPERRGPARRAPARLHRHRRLRPLHAHERPQRAARDGLRRIRSPRRAVRGGDAASTRAPRSRRTSPTCGASSAPSASGTTPAVASPPPTSTTTAGRSGSSCSSSTPGTTTSRRGPGRSPSSSPSSRRARGRRRATPTPTTWPGPSSTRAAQRAVVDSYRLAYLDEAPVNWCPALGTVLANEEVTADGRSERGNHPVFRRPLKQWMLRITAYADRLLADLDLLDWPESIKMMQRNWIGRSVGRRSSRSRSRSTRASTSRCSRRVPTRCSAPPTWCSRPSTRWSTRSCPPSGPTPRSWPMSATCRTRGRASSASTGSRGGGGGVPRVRGAEVGARAPGRRPGEDRRVHRRVRQEPHERLERPDLRRRLRADGLRHRGDHGGARARRARLRVRARVRPPDRRRRAAARRLAA